MQENCQIQDRRSDLHGSTVRKTHERGGLFVSILIIVFPKRSLFCVHTLNKLVGSMDLHYSSKLRIFAKWKCACIIMIKVKKKFKEHNIAIKNPD